MLLIYKIAMRESVSYGKKVVNFSFELTKGPVIIYGGGGGGGGGTEEKMVG